MTEDELMAYSERAMTWAYGKFYSGKQSSHKDDLMQEARIAILKEYRLNKVDDETFKHWIPTLALRGMIEYLRRIYHYGAKSGYLETPLLDNMDVRTSKDYTIKEWELFYDIRTVTKTYTKKNPLPRKIIDIMVFLYQGYGFTDIARIYNVNKGNICRSSKRFGKRLLSAWSA